MVKDFATGTIESMFVRRMNRAQLRAATDLALARDCAMRTARERSAMGF
jgi:hypothetical protein